MSDRHRLRDNFERNKLSANAKSSRRNFWRSLKVYWAYLAAVTALAGSILLLPGNIFSFGEHISKLKEAYVENWLDPKKWEGAYSTRAEGYVDSVDLALSENLDAYIFLYFEEDIGEYDGEVVSQSFCEAGYPYGNILVRGVPNKFFPQMMDVVFFDFVGGQKKIFGDATGTLDGAVLQMEGWIFGGGSRLARDLYIDRKELTNLCAESFDNQ